MKTTRYRHSRPPRQLRQLSVRLDHVPLVPASLLPLKAQWQAIANDLPAGDVLTILPTTHRPQRRTLRQVASLLRGKGHQVLILPADTWSRPLHFADEGKTAISQR